MTVSLELFLAVQWCSCFCLLTALSRLSASRTPGYLRLLLVSLLSAGCTLLIALFGTSLAHVLGAVLLNLLTPLGALGWLPLPRRVRAASMYLLLNLVLEGSLRFLSTMGCPILPAALLASLGALALPRLRRHAQPLPITRAEIRWHDRSVCLNALVDSGNLLWDPITGLPVIVCSREALNALVPRTLPGTLPEGFRYLSVRTAAGGGLMPCFRPACVRLLGPRGWQEVRAVVGLSPSGYNGFQALIPASLLQAEAEIPAPRLAHPTGL